MPDATGVQDGAVEAQGAADGQAVGSTRSQHRVRGSRAQERTLLVTKTSSLIVITTRSTIDHFDLIHYYLRCRISKF